LCGERRSGGSAFQTTGAAMEKLRWPMVGRVCPRNEQVAAASRTE